jgi:phenylacetaldehyde dehydrogenase
VSATQKRRRFGSCLALPGVEPTVLAKTNRDMRVVREEIFGPVVCVQSFDDDDLEVVAKFTNDTEYGLQANVWTRDLRVAHMMARRIKAGTICINNHNYGNPAWPFGGYKQSGWGREGQRGYGALYGDKGGRGQAVKS